MKKTNKADGAAGGRYAAGLLSAALGAEASHTSMDEDGAKVDLKLSLRNVYSKNSLITAHCQVKHGKSYRANPGEPADNAIKLRNIESSTLEALRFGGQPALLIWVPPSPSNTVYWEIIPPGKKKKTPIIINPFQVVTPGLSYELCRYYNNLTKTQPFSQVTLEKNPIVLSEKLGRLEYGNLKNTCFKSPIAGEINITRFAWRHITRRSRSTKARTESLEILSQLKNFLPRNPTKYATTRYPALIHSKSVLETRDLLFTYDNAIRKGSESFRLLVRIREEIRYPKLWRTLPLSTDDVQQRATLMSWWYKK